MHSSSYVSAGVTPGTGTMRRKRGPPRKVTLPPRSDEPVALVESGETRFPRAFFSLRYTTDNPGGRFRWNCRLVVGRSRSRDSITFLPPLLPLIRRFIKYLRRAWTWTSSPPGAGIHFRPVYAGDFFWNCSWWLTGVNLELENNLGLPVWMGGVVLALVGISRKNSRFTFSLEPFFWGGAAGW